MEESQECTHPEITNHEGVEFCDDCGLKLEEYLLNNEQYGIVNAINSATSGNNFPSNPGRCHLRKDTDRNLYIDLESRGFPQRIIERANDYYKTIIEDKIFRAKNRLGIVFACVFYAYIDFDEPQTSNELAKRFDIDRKSMSSGLKTFSEVFKNSRTKKHISPISIAPKLLIKVGVADNLNEIVSDITRIYTHAITQKTSLKTAVPQTVASGLVYYYLKLSGNKITRGEFSKVTGITEITFIKIAKEIADAIGADVKL